MRNYYSRECSTTQIATASIRGIVYRQYFLDPTAAELCVHAHPRQATASGCHCHGSKFLGVVPAVVTQNMKDAGMRLISRIGYAEARL